MGHLRDIKVSFIRCPLFRCISVASVLYAEMQIEKKVIYREVSFFGGSFFIGFAILLTHVLSF